MGDVNVTVSASTEGLSSGLAKAQQSVSEFKKEASEKFNEVGGEFTKMFAAGAVVEGLMSVGEEMERVQKLAIRFGESAESVQRVSQAAKENGTDLETVAKAMQKVTANGVEALKGNDKLTDAFDTLGISAKDFVDLPMEEKLSRLAQAYEEGGSNALKLDASLKIMGKSAGELIPMFKQGSDALREQFESATVASNDAVNSIAEANERLEHSFATLKAWGADALGWIAEKARGLGYGLAAITAYVENLPHGFKAARQAAEEAMQAAADMENDAQARHDKQMQRAKQGETGEQIAAGADKDTSKEDALQKLRDENAQKQHEAHERKLSLVQREYELLQGVASAEKDIANAKAKGDESAALKADNRRLDFLKELSENGEKQRKEQEMNLEEWQKGQVKAAKETAKASVEAKKEELSKAEDSLHKLEEGRHGFTVDSLRQSGGSIAGANYRGQAIHEELQKQAVNLQKQTVEQLKSVVKALEDKEKFMNFAGDGSYSA